MKYQVSTSKTLEETYDALQKSISENKFGLQHTHNVHEKLKAKDVELGRRCLILDICQPHIAKEILDIDPSVSSILPCSISIYEDEGKTNICVVKPSFIFPQLNENLKEVMQRVEKTIFKIIDEAA
ncbi:hypothetical protein CPG37_08305 [Malaciobacter canalis]|uniref:DUF302 domain-containing protein n=1 Tax=Malaciobacter canalis TaxID=1912871 RepID=A0ABX4LPP9_9BACT|nr:DUF302 domain-containing protein [Malaciobacter canalis]PHO09723.1 hypothetical protein CPG37_08305 [Malaciobacter canalis]QEE34066.1 DUF302 domain-containing protein [Malaciobacter canalis]